MKNIALLIAMVGSVVFSRGIAFADDADKPLQTKKPGEQISPAVAAHQPANPNGAVSRANEKPNIVQPHNAPLSSSAKSSLPINAGQQHGPAVIGGANAAKNGVVNGTEIKRRP